MSAFSDYLSKASPETCGLTTMEIGTPIIPYLTWTPSLAVSRWLLITTDAPGNGFGSTPTVVVTDITLHNRCILILIDRAYSPVKGKRIHWPGGREGPPPDVPKCGFLGTSPSCQGSGNEANLLIS